MTTQKRTQLIVTTNPGLEDVAMAEFEHRFALHQMLPASYQARPLGIGGRLLVETEESLAAALSIAHAMRSIHHIHRPVTYFDLPKSDPLAYIRKSLGKIAIQEMEDATTFRVTSKRSGIHDFTSIDVQKAAGAGLVDHYGRKVDLTAFDTNVRVDIDDDLCSVMVQVTRTPLDYRYDYAFRPRVALKTNVAFAMLVLAGIEPNGVPLPASLGVPGPSENGSDKRLLLLDPFCGSGTILLEAGASLPCAKLVGSDRYEKPVSWARDNLIAAGLGERIEVIQEDARDINDHYPADTIDVIVTNPPFGAQLAQETNFYTLYWNFLSAAREVIKPEGRIVMLVWKRTVFNRVVKRLGLQICHARVIDLGGLFPGIFVLKKK